MSNLAWLLLTCLFVATTHLVAFDSCSSRTEGQDGSVNYRIVFGNGERVRQLCGH